MLVAVKAFHKEHRVMHGRPDPKALPDFLSGSGQMGALIRARNWAATPLGPPHAWSQTLKTLVSVMLGSSQPMFIAWGPSASCSTMTPTPRS
ncbi:hypothetical protein JH26_03660 [Microvirga sp. BSC39]|nr:hypothetical protein JH26_03660 [Microvirga sp. BSC39]